MNFLTRLFFNNVDKILNTLISALQKLDQLAEKEAAKAQKLADEAAKRAAEGERARRVAEKLKDLVS